MAPQLPRSRLSLRAITFTFTSLETGSLLGAAVLAPAARYASVHLAGAPMITRKFLSPSLWQQAEQEISVGLNPGPLPAKGAIAQALASSEFVVIHYLHAQDVAVERPELTVQALDALLRSEPLPRPHFCRDGWVCEQHPGRGWPHDDCAGPGMPCPHLSDEQR